MSPAQVRDEERARLAAAAYPGLEDATFDLDDPELMGAIFRDLLRFEGERSASGKRVTPAMAEGIASLQGMMG